jgi:hypothetical protein
MSSYALLGALSGFRYSAVERTLWFAPRLKTRPFQCFFSTASGFGTISLHDRTVTVNIIEGELSIDKAIVTDGEGLPRTFPTKSVASPDAPVAWKI